MSSFTNLHGPGHEQFPANLGQTTSAGSMSVTIASDQSSLPVTVSNASVGVAGAASPTSATAVGGKDGSGNLQIVKVSSAGVLSVDGSATVQPVSQSGTWTLVGISGTISLPTGAATETTLAALSAKHPATLGQKAMAASLAVVLASDQSAIPVSQSGTWNVTNVSGTVSLPTGASTSALQTSGNSSLTAIAASVAGTLAISAAALPLPAGASTSALQTALNAQIPATLGSKVSASSLAVVIASDQAAIPVTVALGATSALQTSGNASLTTIATNTPAVGQAAMAASSPVVLASNQSAIPVTQSGTFTVTAATRASNLVYRNDNSSGSITTAAYTQIVASSAGAINRLYIADTSGSSFKIATGAAASEVDVIYVGPGGQDAPYEINIPASTRISVKALDTSMTSGQLIITGLS